MDVRRLRRLMTAATIALVNLLNLFDGCKAAGICPITPDNCPCSQTIGEDGCQTCQCNTTVTSSEFIGDGNDNVTCLVSPCPDGYECQLLSAQCNSDEAEACSSSKTTAVCMRQSRSDSSTTTTTTTTETTTSSNQSPSTFQRNVTTTTTALSLGETLENCCVNDGMPSNCLKFCSYNVTAFEDASFLELIECDAYVGTVIQCATDCNRRRNVYSTNNNSHCFCQCTCERVAGSNRTDCCIESGISVYCLGFCSGDANATPDNPAACLPYVKEFMACYSTPTLLPVAAVNAPTATSSSTTFTAEPTSISLQNCPTLECPAAFSSCYYGKKLDQMNCETCECADPCEGINCGGPNKICRVKGEKTCREDMCFSNSNFRGYCIDAVPNCSDCVNVSCPFGQVVNDADGCLLCDCYDPCKNSNCPSNVGCEVVKQHSCDPISGWCTENYSTGCHISDACNPVNCFGAVCSYGLVKDSKGCINETCTCFDPCKDVNCPYGSQCQPVYIGSAATAAGNFYIGQCILMPSELSTFSPSRTPLTPTQVGDEVGEPTSTTTSKYQPTTTTTDKMSERASNVSATTAKTTCTELVCATFCSYGWSRDFHGCQTCVCIEPCQEMLCPPAASCQIQMMSDRTYTGSCVFDQSSVNGLLKIDADFQIIDDSSKFSQEVSRQIASKVLHCDKDAVTVVKLEYGSIIVQYVVTPSANLSTSDVLSKLQNWLGEVTITYNGVDYPAKLVQYWEQHPWKTSLDANTIKISSSTTTSLSSVRPSSNFLLLVVLIPVIVPICLIVIVVAIILTCRVYKLDHIQVLRPSRASSSSASNTDEIEISRYDSKPTRTKGFDNPHYDPHDNVFGESSETASHVYSQSEA